MMDVLVRLRMAQVTVFRRAVPASVHVQICTVRRLFFFAFHFNLQIGQFVVISSDRL